MSAVRDPTYQVRRLLWVSYVVLAVALLCFLAAAFVVGQHVLTGVNPPAVLPSTGPGPGQKAAPTQSAAPQPSVPPATPVLAGTSGTGSTSSSTVRYARGEPAGDIEDDTPPQQASAQQSAGSSLPRPSAPALPLPSVPGAVPVLPTPHL